MVKISLSDDFETIFFKIKDKITKEKIIKQLEKIKQDPEVGKPMGFKRKGTREVYIKPFRLSYIYFKEKDEVVLLDFYHKDEQ